MKIFALILASAGSLSLAQAQLKEVSSWKPADPPDGLPGTATLMRKEGTYIREVSLLRPRPATTAAELSAVNPRLPALLRGFGPLMESAELSTRFNELYNRKLKEIRKGELLTNHNYFDCHTVLRLSAPGTGRKALLVQADMDVVTDGSDPARAKALTDYDLARTSNWFLPETAYSWTRKASDPSNPFLEYYPDALKKLETLRKQLETEAKADGGVIWRELIAATDDQIYRIKARGMGAGTRKGLRTRRYLLAEKDPFVVLPVPWVNKSAAWSPQIGDYAAVIHGKRIYPVILGDAGPSFKVGEASLRLARAINPKSNGRQRAVSDLSVTYLFFPRTASPKRKPDPAAWRDRVRELLEEIGGLANPDSLHDWATPN